MKLDYLNILQKKGFKIPKDESQYDYDMMEEILDNRHKNIDNVLNYALNGFKVTINKDNIILGKINKKDYSLLVTENSVICKLCQKENTFNENREFSLVSSENGFYIFRRVLLSSAGILDIDFNIANPYSPNYITITGYDKDTLELIKESITPSDNVPYERGILEFLKDNKILPDMIRKLTVYREIEHLKSNTSIIEEDLISGNNSRSVIGIINDKVSDFILLENFIRQKNYVKELEELKGLPIVLKMNV